MIRTVAEITPGTVCKIAEFPSDYTGPRMEGCYIATQLSFTHDSRFFVSLDNGHAIPFSDKWRVQIMDHNFDFKPSIGD